MFKRSDQIICINARAREFLANGNIYTVDKDQIGNLVKVAGTDEAFYARRFELCTISIVYPTLRCNYV